jgi:hypothetical protein
VLVQLCDCLGVQEQEDVKLPLRLLLQLLQSKDTPRRKLAHVRKESMQGELSCVMGV